MKLNVFQFIFFLLAGILFSACNYINNKIYDAAIPSYKMEVVLKNVDGNIERTIEILKIRFQEYDAKIDKDGENILIELEDVKDTAAAKVLLKRGKLEFFEACDNLLIFPFIQQIHDSLLLLPDETYYKLFPNEIKKDAAAAQFSFIKERDTSEIRSALYGILTPNVMRNEADKVALANGPCIGRSLVKDTAKVNAILALNMEKYFLSNSLKFLWTVKTEKYDSEKEQLGLIAMKKQPIFDKNIIEYCMVDFNKANQPEVIIKMDEFGAQIWKDITSKLASKQPKGSIVVVLDDKVCIYPTVQDEMPNGRISITLGGSASLDEARALVSVFKVAEPISITLLHCRIHKN